MNLIRFFIPLLLATNCLIISCKKESPGKSGLADSSQTLPPNKSVIPDSSKLLPSVISYYNNSNSLLSSSYYTYDNSNRIIKLVMVSSGITTYSKTFSYDANDNLTNITELNASNGTVPNIVSPGLSLGANTNPAVFDITKYVIHYTNNIPDSTVVTGSITPNKTIKYVVENNRISTIKTFTYAAVNIGIVGAGSNPIKFRLDSTITTYEYNGDDLALVTANDGKTILNYNVNKSAFYSLNVKWPLITESGFIVFPKIFTKYDIVKIIVPFSVEFISYSYYSLYNKNDYPVETQYYGTIAGALPNGNLLPTVSITPLKIKYQYILAK